MLMLRGCTISSYFNIVYIFRSTNMNKHIRFSFAYERKTVDVNPGGHWPQCCSAAGLVLGPLGLADLDPTCPQFCSTFLSLKAPTPFRHPKEPRPGSFFPICFPYDVPFGQVAQRKVTQRGGCKPYLLSRLEGSLTFQTTPPECGSAFCLTKVSCRA